MANRDNLSINLQVVCFIITRAKEFQAKEGVTFPETTQDSEYEYDWAQILADHADDLTYVEVKRTIESLELAQQADLLALMYLGRGDYFLEEWNEALKEARNNLAPDLTGYLLSKPMIAYYLEKALEYFDYSCDE